MQYYVVDTTVSPVQEKRFTSYSQIVTYLEGMCQRAFKETRKNRMILLESLGHGYDDSNSVAFVRSMAQQFNMGVIRDGVTAGEKMRCDITAVELFQNDEFGN